MIYLVLALASSLTIAILLRWVERRELSRLVVVTCNYITAGILALGGGSGRGEPLPVDVTVVGVGLGGLFLAGFLLFGLAMRREGMAAAVTMGRISLILPVAVAVGFFGETPGIADAAALIMIVVVFWAWEGGQRRVAPILLALFLLFGAMNATMKWFAAVHPNVPESRFLTLVFLSALVCGGMVLAVNRQRIRAIELVTGLVLGVPNYYASFFLVRALERLPAFVVFPVVDTGVILLSTLAGVLLFGERPGRRKMVCIGFAAAAIIVLGLSRGNV